MLNATETLAIAEAQQALIRHCEPALAERLGAILLGAARHRASMASAAATRTPGSRGRQPAVAMRVEVEPGYVQHVLGAKAAQAAVVEALRSLGDARAAPTAHSMGVMLSRQGAWTTLVETDNGVVSITVRRAPETGTDLANAQTVPKPEKRR